MSVRFGRPIMMADGNSISTHLPRLTANQHCHITTRDAQNHSFFILRVFRLEGRWSVFKFDSRTCISGSVGYFRGEARGSAQALRRMMAFAQSNPPPSQTPERHARSASISRICISQILCELLSQRLVVSHMDQAKAAVLSISNGFWKYSLSFVTFFSTWPELQRHHLREFLQHIRWTVSP